MNKKGNQRYLETKQKIQDTFLELLDEKELRNITVSEICKRSGIHRTTFYGHYEDVYDLMNQMLKEMYTELIGFFTTEKGSRFLGMFELVQEHQTFFRYYLKNEGTQKEIEKLLPVPLQERLDMLVENLGYQSENELLYHQTFFRGGLVAIMRRWLARGCRETPEEMCKIIADEYELPDRKAKRLHDNRCS